MRAFEDCSCPHSEIQFAGIATMKAFLTGRDSLFGLALWALDTVLPQAAFKVLSGGWFVRKQTKQLKGADCAFAHFASFNGASFEGKSRTSPDRNAWRNSTSSPILGPIGT
jgi:hypothetical protein